MKTFTVRRYVDAYVVYEAEVTASSAVEAAKIARKKDDTLTWEECYTSTFDARSFVTLADEGGEIEETTQGDII